MLVIMSDNEEAKDLGSWNGKSRISQTMLKRMYKSNEQLKDNVKRMVKEIASRWTSLAEG